MTGIVGIAGMPSQSGQQVYRQIRQQERELRRLIAGFSGNPARNPCPIVDSRTCTCYRQCRNRGNFRPWIHGIRHAGYLADILSVNDEHRA